jgi:hypothetical protein
MSREDQTMTDYAVLLPGDEAAWEASSPEHREQTFQRHDAFSKALIERGHEIFGGAELAPSRKATTLRTDADGHHTVTEGPYAESVEQLSGFYLVRTDDLADLVEVCKLLADGDGAIEIREMLGEPER